MLETHDVNQVYITYIDCRHISSETKDNESAVKYKFSFGVLEDSDTELDIWQWKTAKYDMN